MQYEKGLEIEKVPIKKIIKLLEPLDLLVFKGHVIIVLDNKNVIESREYKGVIATPIEVRLEELMLTKKPVNTYKNADDFVIRRWL